jgi:hypothetical protein
MKRHLLAEVLPYALRLIRPVPVAIHLQVSTAGDLRMALTLSSGPWWLASLGQVKPLAVIRQPTNSLISPWSTAT